MICRNKTEIFCHDVAFFFFKCVIADKLSASLQNCSCNKISHLDSVERQRVKWTRLSPNIMVFIAVLCQNRLSGPSIFFFLLHLTSPLFWSLSRWGASKLRCYQAVRGSLDCFPERALKKSDSCLPPQNPNNISGTVPLLPCSLSQLSVKHTPFSTNCCFSYYLLSLTRGRQTDTPLSVYVSAACPSFT